MKLIFIRHGDPDYVHDSLTEKGMREAALLGERVKDWKVDSLYVSCLGRARKTAEPIEAALHKKGIVLDWLQEFRARIDRRYGDGHPWDFTPAFLAERSELYDREKWYDAEVMRKTGDLPSVKEVYLETCEKLDALLAEHGCCRDREKGYYRIDSGNDETIVFVCHMAITFVMLSHLLGISFPALVHGIFLPPTSITVAGSEEMEPGIAAFRCQGMGDVRHLYRNGEPASGSGYFGDMFLQ